jgi:hypothetical protein
MGNWPFVEGRLHAPYFIFVAGRHSDADLLRHFGLPTYRLSGSAQRLRRYAILADDRQWTMIADDWFYTLWHMPSTRPAVRALGQVCDVFACSVGDCDHSFDFEYYRDSQLVRHYVVEDPEIRGGRVVINKGKRLPGEKAAFREGDELNIVLGVAASLGIRTDFTDRDIRIYSEPESRGQ